jgi:MYXO-CTERM domain-containing protein
MKALCISVVMGLTLLACGQAEKDVVSSTYAIDEPDAGCTNGNCPVEPDAGCTNGNCPPEPDAGCTNNNCPPIPDAGCTNNNCPPVPDAGCTNNNCPPPPDAAPIDAHVLPPFPVCCIPVANVTQHLCCGLVDDVISCRLSTIPDHQVIHDAFLAVFCDPKNPAKCRPIACRPDWWPEEAEDPVPALPEYCSFWGMIKNCDSREIYSLEVANSGIEEPARTEKELMGGCTMASKTPAPPLWLFGLLGLLFLVRRR